MEHAKPVSREALGEEFHRACESALGLARKRLGQTHRLWIGGKFIKTKGGSFTRTLPANHRMVAGQFPKATREQVRQAVAAAQAVTSLWHELGWQQRIAYLRKTAELMTQHQYELAMLLSLEVGKNRFDAFAEVSEAIQTVLYYCQQTERHQGFVYRLNGSGQHHHQCALRPHGVWALVTPFNFPLAVPVGTAAAALAGGNTVVFKPSSAGGVMAARLAMLLHDAGLPVGVFNLVTGPGREVATALTGVPGVNGLAFSGSTEVGLGLLRRFAGPYPRPCLAAMGGSNPVIVMPTANLEEAAEGIIHSAFAVNGQHCSRCARVYVHRKIGAQLVEALRERAATLAVGDPLERDTVMGPLINEAAVARYKQAVALGKKQGRLRLGGKMLSRGAWAQGWFVEPAIVDRLPVRSRWFNEEWLVPVLGVAEVQSLAEALTFANQSAYGMAAGIFTQVAEEQVAFFNHIEAAATYCNRTAGATTGTCPGLQSVGGWKASGSSCRNAMGPFYVPQFLREQSQTIAG